MSEDVMNEMEELIQKLGNKNISDYNRQKLQKEYDMMIDKYMFRINQQNKNTKSKRDNEEYSILTYKQMEKKNTMEMDYDFTRDY
jgi:hypothetical protein